MNKLTVLYSLIKNIKEAESCKGTLEAEGFLDQTPLGTMTAHTQCGPDNCEKHAEFKFGTETLTFSRSGKNKDGGQCCEGHHPHPHFHGGCCGPKGKLSKAMFLLKALDKLQLEESVDGTKTLILALEASDLPEGMLAHMKDKCCSHHKKDSCCAHPGLKQWMAETGCSDLNPETCEPSSFRIKATLDKSCRPLMVEGDVIAKCQDSKGTPRTLKLAFKGSCAQ